MHIVPFIPDHARHIVVQRGQRGDPEIHTPEELADVGEAFTGIREDAILFCAGRAHGNWVWAIVSEGAGKFMVSITKTIMRLLSLHGNDGPLLAAIDRSFPEAARWMGILGFKFVGEDSEWKNFDIYRRG